MTGVFPGIACRAYRFQASPPAQAPSRLACLRCPARLAEALARFWCQLGVMVIAIGWQAAETRPNRPTEPAWNWTLPGASRAVTFAEK